MTKVRGRMEVWVDMSQRREDSQLACRFTSKREADVQPCGSSS